MAFDLINLPWTKREIIAAALAEYKPFLLDDEDTWGFFIQIRALRRLALSDKAPVGFGVALAERLQSGTPVMEIEDAVCARLGRVLSALREGRDPDAAYDMPSRGEMN